MSPWVPPYPEVRPKAWRGMAGNGLVAAQMKFLAYKMLPKVPLLINFTYCETAVLKCLV